MTPKQNFIRQKYKKFVTHYNPIKKSSLQLFDIYSANL